MNIVFASVATMALIGGIVLSVPSQAMASEPTSNLVCDTENTAKLSVPVSTFILGHTGSKHKVADKELANGYYKIKVTSVNQGSVHPNSNIIVTSSNDQVVVSDVEDKSFSSKTADGLLNVTDGHIKVLVQLGRDMAFSGGLSVDLHACTVPEQPPVTPEEPPVPPETPEQPPVTPEEPVTPNQKPDVMPQMLPETGPGSVFGLILGSGALAGATHAYIRSRRYSK